MYVCGACESTAINILYVCHSLAVAGAFKLYFENVCIFVDAVATKVVVNAIIMKLQHRTNEKDLYFLPIR